MAVPRSEQPKLTLNKDGTVLVDGAEVALADLAGSLKQKGATKILVRQMPGFLEHEAIETAFQEGELELATYIDEKGDTLFRIRYDEKDDEPLKLDLVKGGVRIEGEMVSFAELADALQKRGASEVAINTTPARGAGDDPMLLQNALSAGGVRQAQFERETGEIQAVITFAQEGDPEPAEEAGPVKIYRVKEKVEIDGKLFTNAELAAELKRRKAVKVLIYLKEPGCIGEDAIAFGQALRDSGIDTAEYRDAHDRPQAISVFKEELRRAPRGGKGGGAAADAAPAAAPPAAPDLPRAND